VLGLAALPRRAAAAETVWLFGLHAVRDALLNPRREKLRLVLTKNAADRLGGAIAAGGLAPEIVDPRKFDAHVAIGADSVHQGAALEAKPLAWGAFDEVCAGGGTRALVVLLDRVTDPHNVGAILRSAEVFGARAVIAPARHAAPETGALAKTASGALERQPYLRVGNLSEAMERLAAMGYVLLGLDGTAGVTLAEGLAVAGDRPVSVRDLVVAARRLGFESINADLIYGLPKQPSQRSVHEQPNCRHGTRLPALWSGKLYRESPPRHREKTDAADLPPPGSFRRRLPSARAYTPRCAGCRRGRRSSTPRRHRGPGGSGRSRSA